jgi:hypothetical protein
MVSLTYCFVSFKIGNFCEIWEFGYWAGDSGPHCALAGDSPIFMFPFSGIICKSTGTMKRYIAIEGAKNETRIIAKYMYMGNNILCLAWVKCAMVKWGLIYVFFHAYQSISKFVA